MTQPSQHDLIEMLGEMTMQCESVAEVEDVLRFACRQYPTLDVDPRDVEEALEMAYFFLTVVGRQEDARLAAEIGLNFSLFILAKDRRSRPLLEATARLRNPAGLWSALLAQRLLERQQTAS